MRQQRLFRQMCLGYFLDIDADLVFSKNFVYHMIMHEVDTDAVVYEL